ncbi:HAD family hydrolase [Spongiibacter sp.]|uniref:HAD family hydrolase n=1 Tax=Spongiibacter sp. TaxID=2024860 RepID=UPI00356B054F
MVIIFDWDGTLLDSSDKIVSCMQQAAQACGVAPRSAADIRDIIGLELVLAIATLYPECGRLEVLAIRDAYARCFVEADRRPCAFFAGVAEGLRRLHGDGHTLCVATGKSRKGLNRVFSHLPEAGLFAASRCADETASKPDPLMLRELCEELRVSPAEAVMVGDTEYDLEMASRFAIPSIGVSYGVHHPDRLRRWEPLAVIDCFDELHGEIARLQR